MTRKISPRPVHARLSHAETADLAIVTKVVCVVRLVTIALLVFLPSSQLYAEPGLSTRTLAVLAVIAFEAAISIVFISRWDQTGRAIAGSWWWPVIEGVGTLTLLYSYGLATPGGEIIASTVVLTVFCSGRWGTIVAAVGLTGGAVLVLADALPTLRNGLPGVSMRSVSMLVFAGAFLMAAAFARRVLLGQGEALRSRAVAESREAVLREQIRAADDVRYELSELIDHAQMIARELATGLAGDKDKASVALAHQLVDGLTLATDEMAALSCDLHDERSTDVSVTCRSIVMSLAQSMPSVAVAMETVDSPVDVAGNVQHVVTRALSELLDNVRLHSWAATVNVSLTRGVGTATLRVADDGVGLPDGLDLTAFRRAGHFGLAVLDERVREIDGSFSVASDGHGTIATITFPTLAPVEGSIS